MSSGPPHGVSRRRRFSKWAIFAAGFAFFPVFLDYLSVVSSGRDPALAELFPPTNAYLLGFGLSVGGLGDLLFEENRPGLAKPGSIGVTVASIVSLSVGAFLYADSKNAASPVTITIPLIYLGVALCTSAATVWVSTRP